MTTQSHAHVQRSGSGRTPQSPRTPTEIARAAAAQLVAQWRRLRSALGNRRTRRMARRGAALGLAASLALAPLGPAAHAAITPPARFVEQFGGDNPLSGIAVADALSGITFVDIDADGDPDAFIGSKSEGIRYFENTGTATAPVFTQRTGDQNPLAAVPDPSDSPNFADVDGDGDLDAIVAVFSCVDESCDPRIEPYQFYENVGTASAPSFVLRTDAANPFNALTFFVDDSPELVDLDGDGDFDAVSLLSDNTTAYYENTGTPTSPSYVQRTGAQNPLATVERVPNTPTFVDIDGDGDRDLFAGSPNNDIVFYENVGTARTPVFEKQSGALNPFDGVGNSQNATPAFADLDGDGDIDAVLVDLDPATSDPTIRYFENQPDIAIHANSTAREAGQVGASFVITRPAGTLVEPITVGYSLGGTAFLGDDYRLVPDANAQLDNTTITLAPGVASATIMVVPVDDRRNEADETIVLTLIPAAGGVASPQSALVVIVDDDTATRVLLPLVPTR